MTAILGDYDLLTRLASGGMAEVHVARSRTSGEIAIVKQMLQKFVNKPEFVEMFLDEGRVVSSLHHPNIVAMRDFGFHEELPYLAMEYLHGVDLRTLMRTLALRRSMMPLEAVIFIVKAICGGLHHAHEAHTIDGRPMEIIHRDVSPQNVVVTFDGGVKLIDFGIAKARGRSHETRSGTLKGKVPYMSPEQVRSGKIDRRSDVYAVGVMLYELVVGRRPYVGNKATGLDEFGLMMAIVNHDIVPASAVRAGLHPRFNDVIMRALEANVIHRYQSALELQGALTAVATELNLVATAEQLAGLMIRTLGQRISWAEAARSNEQIVEQVSVLEHCKTVVGEDHDPATVDPSEVAPELRLKTGDVRKPEGLEDEASPSSPGVDKVVDADVTRLRFRRPIGPSFRWGKLFDGIEGVVEIDFTSATTLTAATATSAAEALRKLGREVTEIRLIAAPIALVNQVSDRCRVLTIAAQGRCQSCNTTRATLLTPDELQARIAPDGTIPCPHCSTRMVVENFQRAPVVETARPEVIEQRPMSTVPEVGETPAPRADTEVQARPSDPRRGGLYVGIGVAALAAAGAAIWLTRPETREKPSRPTPTVGRSWEEGENFLAEGRAVAPTTSAANAAARTAAMRVLIAAVEERIPANIRMFGGRASGAEVVANVESQLGAWIDFEARLVTSKASGNGIEAIARYALSRADVERAVDFYSARRIAWGFEIVNAPPSRPPGVLVLTPAGTGSVTAGDQIVAVDRKPLGSLDDVTPELLAKAQLELNIEHREQRTIRVQSAPK